jgi:two-component system, response regulator PdtaR
MKLLIVDDEEIVRLSLRRAAELKGHEVFEAKDGEEGLEMWRRLRPELVFLDVLMPGLTGPQVLEEIGDRQDAKVILISAYTGQEKSKRWPPYDLFIAKPFANIFDVVSAAEKLI